MAKNDDKKKDDGVKLTQADIYAMRAEFFDRVTDADMRAKILTIAFAYGDEVGTPNATDMMAWYLAQPENRDQIDEMALEYMGYTPDGVGESDEKEQSGKRDK
jgi:hypothetical protein